MEDAVGHRLFTREVRGVTLTDAGSIVVEHAARILNGVTALRHDLDSLGDQFAGRISVGGFPAAMSVLVPHTVARLGRDHPGLTFTLTEASTPALLRDVHRGRIDIAVIAVGDGLPEYDLVGLATHRVYGGGLCVAVPNGHRLAGASQVPVRDLSEEPWIAGTGSAGDPQFAAWPTLHDPEIRYRVRGWPARLGLVAAGLGVCLIPVMAARSVPDGVTTVGVEDPTWPGRRTLAVTALQPTEPVLVVVAALRGAAAELAQETR